MHTWHPHLLEDIEQYLKVDHLRPEGLDVYDDCFETGVFVPLQRKRELARMMQTARAINPRVVCEVGADKGGGLYHWYKCLPSVQTIIACEIRGLPYKDLFQQYLHRTGYVWIDDGSRSPIAEKMMTVWSSTQRQLIDVLFLDGDKLAFEQDFDFYLRWVSPHGIVFMHDVQDGEPGRAFRRVAARGFRHEVILDTSESLEALEREKRGEPARGSYDAWLRYWKGGSCGVGVIWLGGN